MKWNKNYLLGLLGASALAWSMGCTPKEQPVSNDIQLGEQRYHTTSSNVVQTLGSFTNDGRIVIGAVSDLEGSIENARSIATRFKTNAVDVVLIAGDLYENERIRRNPLYPQSTDNILELIKDVEPFAQLAVPVFVIPGNHEDKNVYELAVMKLQKSYPNVFDIHSKTADLKGCNIVGLGGYYDSRFVASNGFLLQNSNYAWASNALYSLESIVEPTFFLTHSPPLSRSAIDEVGGFGHVGDPALRTIMNSRDLYNVINIHGHIHEGGGKGEVYRAGPSVNVSSVTSFSNHQRHRGILITIRESVDALQLIDITYQYLTE